MPLDDVRAAYTTRAEDYTAALGHIDAAHPADRDLVARWVETLDGPVIDAGCGPGQWTKFLQDLGASIEGVDLVPAFITQARTRFPEVRFRVGELDDLRVPHASFGGILAWYSIIHMPPADLPAVLEEFARCVRPGGGLLLGFFEGPALETFPHAVTPACYWPIDELVQRLDTAGFETLETHSRVDPGHRPHAAIVARRTNT